MWRDRWGAANFGPFDEAPPPTTFEIYYEVLIEGVLDQLFEPLPPPCKCPGPDPGPWDVLKKYWPCQACSGAIFINHPLRGENDE